MRRFPLLQKAVHDYDVADCRRGMHVESVPLMLTKANRLLELERFGRDLDPEIYAGVRIETGVPWEAICRAAKAEDADLIFVGTRANGAAEGPLDLTTTLVVNNADRAVFVFREDPIQTKAGATYDAELHCEPF